MLVGIDGRDKTARATRAPQTYPEYRRTQVPVNSLIASCRPPIPPVDSGGRFRGIRATVLALGRAAGDLGCDHSSQSSGFRVQMPPRVHSGPNERSLTARWRLTPPGRLGTSSQFKNTRLSGGQRPAAFPIRSTWLVAVTSSHVTYMTWKLAVRTRITGRRSTLAVGT